MNYGGAAFPRPGLENEPMQVGMSLRDWFAGMALGQALLLEKIETIPQTAEFAYRVADAMLAEKEKRTQAGTPVPPGKGGKA